MVRRVCTQGSERRISRHPLGFRCAIVFTLLATIAVAGFWLMPAKPVVVRAQSGVATSVMAVPSAGVPAQVRAAVEGVAHGARAASTARPVYPLSVVAGGVIDRKELQAVVRRDMVVAAHYATFNVDAARVVRNAKPRAVHVSYRKGDQVFWTAKKVMLAKDETLLTDGVNEMRTRCANRISDVAMLPVASDEPTEELLNALVTADDADIPPAGDEGNSVGRAVLRDTPTGAAASPGWTNVGLRLSDVATSDYGNMGNMGNMGNAGNTSNAGNTGNAGDTGNTGYTGNTGKTGDTGDTGNTGDTANTDSRGKTDKPSDTGDGGTDSPIGVAAVEPAAPGGLAANPAYSAKPGFVEPSDAAFLPSSDPIKPELPIFEQPPFWQPDTAPALLAPAATGDPAAVPEPATLLIVVGTLALLGLTRRRKRAPAASV